jgi:hypothetical protein
MRPSGQREPTVEEIMAGVTSYYRGQRKLYVRPQRASGCRTASGDRAVFSG